MPYKGWRPGSGREKRLDMYAKDVCRHEIPRASCVDCRNDPDYQKEIHLTQPEKNE